MTWQDLIERLQQLSGTERALDVKIGTGDYDDKTGEVWIDWGDDPTLARHDGLLVLVGAAALWHEDCEEVTP